jgi:hypothetical protein
LQQISNTIGFQRRGEFFLLVSNWIGSIYGLILSNIAGKRQFVANNVGSLLLPYQDFSGGPDMRVPLAAVSPGTTLSRPIYGVMGQILLREGVKLTARSIRRLQELGVSAVHIDLGIPEPEDPISEHTRCYAHQMLAQLASNLPNKVQVREVVQSILDEILESEAIIQGMNSISTYDGYTYTHSVDVCILGLGIGVKLGLTHNQLVDLGTGCLLHDIGKLSLPSIILNKPGRLTADEYELVKTHPQQGYNLIVANPDVSSQAAQTVLQHHERWNGSGYPLGKSQQEIHPFAAICGVADTYSAMISNRVYRKAVPSHESYEMLLASGGTWFDFKIIQAFAKCVVPYPPGALVELTNGQAALVVRSSPSHPYVPVVRIVGTDVTLMEEIDLQEARIGIRGLLSAAATRRLLGSTEYASALGI